MTNPRAIRQARIVVACFVACFWLIVVGVLWS
jgi:hypothetical protein